MAVEIEICQYDTCNKVSISDVSTSLYDAGTVTIGGNVVTEAVIVIDEDTTLTYDVLSIFTAATDQSDLIFTSDDVLVDSDGNALSLTDGFHTIDYYVIAGGTTYTLAQKNVLFICNLECCIYKKIAQIPDYYNCNNCENEYIQNTMTAYSMLLSLYSSMASGDLIATERIYDLLTVICNTTNCNCNN